MTQADATRIAALCDQEIVRLLAQKIHTSDQSRILLDLAELRTAYAGSLDLSEMTPQHADLFGDGTPDNICAEAADDNVMPADLRIHIFERRHGS